MSENQENQPGFFQRMKRLLFGSPIDVMDKSIFHKLSLIPVLAWVGLGADGLSSSAYGPEEAFRALGEHTYLAIFLAIAMALTVFIISYAYSRIIEHFPYGGGGYIVATHTLGEKAGVVSGCALLVDYVLTITVSIASCGDSLFSFLPIGYHHYKLPFEVVLIVTLIILNIRGVKESVSLLAPIFITFVATHVFMISYGILTHIPTAFAVADDIKSGFNYGLTSLGGWGMLFLFLHAYSLGGGTYTGIEAVSNGLQIMREPKVQTGKRTMIYMASSLAITASGIFICYLLLRVHHVEGQTLNAVLAGNLFNHWSFGRGLAFITIFSEGALLFVAAQAGFIDGPRVMANMAIDSWFPHRFAALSSRLTMRNGVVMMGVAALLLLFYTHGAISVLIVMYSINVFLTFSLSQLGMSTFFIKKRRTDREWKKHLSVHLVGLALCATILIITTVEKFGEGGWVTLLITSVLIAACYIIKSHYNSVEEEIGKLDRLMAHIPTTGPMNTAPVNPKEMTAIQLVSGFSGFGVHTLLSIVRNFPHVYKNFIFVSVAVVDSGTFKGADEINNLDESIRDSLKKYVELARKLGLPAESRYETGTDVVEVATRVCKNVCAEFPQSTVFTGQLTFRLEKSYHKLLHNETAFAIQRHLQWEGVTTVILPIRVEA